MTIEEPPRVVLDTNVLVSHLLFEGTVERAVHKALATSQPLASEATLRELIDVLARERFDRYVTVVQREAFLRRFLRVAKPVTIIQRIEACRDPRDDKFLELAVNGAAGFIVTGDDDLLALDPFRGIPIVTPAEYLRR